MKGHAQLACVDYNSDTFAHVARHGTIKLLVALAAQLGINLFIWIFAGASMLISKGLAHKAGFLLHQRTRVEV